MANFRYVNTEVWEDPWFVDLRMSEQHLWMYLLTNSRTNNLGIYEISLRKVAFETTIDQEEIKRIFRDRFTPDGKAFFEQGWVIMRNWQKHQNFGPKHVINVERLFNALPEWLRIRLLDESDTIYVPIDTLLIGYAKGIDTLAIKEKKRIEININKTNSNAARESGAKDSDKNHLGISQNNLEQTRARLASQKGF